VAVEALLLKERGREQRRESPVGFERLVGAQVADFVIEGVSVESSLTVIVE
jgi:hypothetical protein